MPLSQCLSNTAQVGSSSRKRSHAETTRSESRSLSPDLPSKRQRSRVSSSSNSSSYSSSPPNFSIRHERDGFDYRRPVMAVNNNNNQVRDTIDLTADDDTPPPASVMTTLAPRRQSSQLIRSASPNAGDRAYTRAPPFGRPQTHQPLVIDLSDDDDEVPGPRRQVTPGMATANVSSSPEVEFVRERPARANLNHQSMRDSSIPSRRPPNPPALDLGAFGTTLPDFIRRGTQFMFGFSAATHGRPVFDEGVMDRIDGLQDHGLVLGPLTDTDPALEIIDDYDGVNLDYRQAAFGMGNRHSETPQIIQEPYKGPPPAQDGFTRNYEEDSILICPWCRDELSTGKEDVKQQVWVVKQCGHVYCGACASSRAIGKIGGKRESKRASNRPKPPFKTCVVDGCGKGLGSKTNVSICKGCVGR